MASVLSKVCGIGPIDAKIVMVGEAPGATEVRTGIPFTGASGDLLTRLMQGAGILRQDVYITNVVKEQPPGNDIGYFIKFGNNGSVKPTPKYLEYEAALYEELKQTNANVYVAIGNVSLYALTRLLAVTKRRGSILSGSMIGGKKVIPIIHPASAMRQYIFTNFIAHDLRRIAEESAFPEIRLPARLYHLKPSYLDTLNYLAKCAETDTIAFDIEVVNEQVSCISLATSPNEVMSIPFVYRGHDYFTVDQEAEIWLQIARILQNPDIKKVGQNIVFDFTFLFRRYGIYVKNLEDTMVAQAICYPDFPKGLDFITSVYTKEPYYKDEGKKWFKFGGSEEDFWLYNAKDSAVCLEAFGVLQTEMSRLHNEDAYKAQVSLIEPLVFMQERGILADLKGMQNASMNADDELKTLQAQLNEVAGCELNSASSKQLQEYFYIKKGLKPYTNRSTGAISVDGLALKRIARKGYKEASIILQMRKLAKLQSTYYDMRIDDDSRIRCAFNPVGTSTGRLSSSKTIFDTGGNMQNLPPAMLSFLSADPGYVLYNIDLAQAENRIVAYIAPEPNMIAAFENKIDLHRQTAGLMLSKPVTEVSDEPGSSSIGGGVYSERFWGKKANHSLNYDLGYRAFALINEISEHESKYIYDRYHATYPGVKQYHMWIRTKLAKDRIIENCFGRRRVFLDRWGDDLFKEAYAYTPQSSVAEIINRRGLNFVYYHQEWFDPVELLNQVHDSIIFQIHMKHSAEVHAGCVLRLVQSLEEPISFRGMTFNIPADVLCGTTLNKKKMKEVPVHEFPSITGLAQQLHAIHRELGAA